MAFLRRCTFLSARCGTNSLRFSTSVRKNTEFENLEVTQQGAVKIIKFNRPKVKNSWNLKLMQEVPVALNEASKDANITVVALSGVGDFFSSGADIPDFARNANDSELLKNTLKPFFLSLHEFPKVLVAVVNGNAVGGGTTILAFCDLVYANEKAVLWTPFVQIGIVQEAASSYFFPRLMGRAKASKLLLLGEKITAKEAESLGLVTQVFPNETFQKEAWAEVNKISQLPKLALTESKNLIREAMNKDVSNVIRHEVDILCDRRFPSDEAKEKFLEFIKRKK